MDKLQVITKALTAFVTAFLMLRAKEYLHVEDLNLASLLQMLIEAVVDACLAGVVYFFTWLIPLGQKYVHERMIGKTVLVKDTTTGMTSVGEVQKVLIQ